MNLPLPITVEEWRHTDIVGPDGPVEVVAVRESHLAWVILTPSHALKIRKPVSLSFLDYRTPSARVTATAEELRLGTRVSPHIYLGHWRLTARPHLLLEPLVPKGEEGEAVLAMTRLDDTLCACRIMGNLDSPPGRLDGAVQDCAAFHLSSPADRGGSGWDDGPMLRMRRAWEVNFEQMPADAPDSPLLPRERERLVTETATWLRGMTDVFRSRVQAGRVRECHGDLRLEHVFLTNPWSVIDPLEFSAALRWVDVAADLGFLGMELDAIGRSDARDHIFNRYASLTGDDSFLSVVPFFLRYRAVVRAKVEWIRSSQLHPEEAAPVMAEARRYAQLALGYSLCL